MSSSCVLVNGLWRSDIAVTDRGLAYGDGLFETLKVQNRKPVLWQRHCHRLVESCRRLGIPFNEAQQKKLSRELTLLCKQLPFDDAVVKILVTRGQGGRGYRVTTPLEPQRILIGSTTPSYPDAYYEAGVNLCLCRTRLSSNPQLAGMKHLNRLEQVLARAEWGDEYAEGLLQDFDDHVIEGTMSNLFVVANEGLLTPCLGRSGVSGIVRNLLIEQALRHGVTVEQRPVSLTDLAKASGLFVTNSLIGVWQVKQFNNHRYSPTALGRQARGWLEDAERNSLLELEGY